MNIIHSKRGRVSARRFDITPLRDALRDGRVWCGVGIVYKPPSEASHYEIETDDSGANADVLVHVELQPAREPLYCRLGAGGSVWRVPPVGTEVAVLIPRGMIEGDPMIVAVLSQAVPAGLDGDTLVISEPKVSVTATGGNVGVAASGDVTVTATGNVKLGSASASAAVVVEDGLPTGLLTWIGKVNTALLGTAVGQPLVGAVVDPPTTLTATKVKAT